MEVTAASEPQGKQETPLDHEERVTPLELFFDLVFVFAITQVTSLMSHHPTWEGLAQGLLVLSAIWWAWAAYSWLTNAIDPDEDVARISMFAAMIAMFVTALAVPGAFASYGMLFGCAYLVVRVLQLLVFAYASPNADVRSALKRLAPGMIGASVLLVAAATQDGPAQGALWVAAFVLNALAPYISGIEGWILFPSHFVERYGLIVIIALGESVVAIGLGLSGVTLDAGLIATAALGLVIVAALWWVYFDIVAIVAEQKLKSLPAAARNRLARDSYSELHFPMIAGIVLLALGVKKAIGHAYEPLDTVPAVALCGGVALYFAAHIAFRLRNVQSWNHQRVVAALACLAVFPLATSADALIAVAAIAVICTGLVAYETTRFREARERIRAGGLPESMMGQAGADR